MVREVLKMVKSRKATYLDHIRRGKNYVILRLIKIKGNMELVEKSANSSESYVSEPESVIQKRYFGWQIPNPKYTGIHLNMIFF